MLNEKFFDFKKNFQLQKIHLCQTVGKGSCFKKMDTSYNCHSRNVLIPFLALQILLLHNDRPQCCCFLPTLATGYTRSTEQDPFTPKSHKYDKHDKASHIISSYPQSHKEHMFSRLFTCYPGRNNSQPLPRHTSKHLLKCNFSKSLTYNSKSKATL